jgi:hypothetical protein
MTMLCSSRYIRGSSGNKKTMPDNFYRMARSSRGRKPDCSYWHVREPGRARRIVFGRCFRTPRLCRASQVAIRECYRGLHRRSSRRGRDSFGMGRRACGRESWQVFVHAVLKSRYRQRACGKGRVLCPGGRGCCMVMRATLYQAVQRADIHDG